MIRSIVSMTTMNGRSRTNAARALLALRANARDNEAAQQAIEDVRRKLAMQHHPSFVQGRARTS